jgi:hypothetical protein
LTDTNTYSVFATFQRGEKGCGAWCVWLFAMWIRWVHLVGCGLTWALIAMWDNQGDVTEVTTNYNRFIRVPWIIPTGFIAGLFIHTCIDLIRRPTTAPWQLLLLGASITGFWLDALGQVHDNDGISNAYLERSTGFYMGYGALTGYAATVFLHATTPYVLQNCGRDIGRNNGYVGGKVVEAPKGNIELSTVSTASTAPPSESRSYSSYRPPKAGYNIGK